jgi:predicted ribosomally synthesized peptide with SipW-like signal peptide
MALGRSAVLVSALAVGALLATGTTYAAFSDYAEVTGNEAVAGTVVIGGDGGAAPDLAYAGLVPGVEKSDAMAVRYAGSIPADVWLELEPGSATQSFCDSSAGAWAAKPGGALQIQVAGGGWQDYCAVVGGERLAIANDVQPDTTLDVQVASRLVDGTDARYSGLTGVDGLIVKALQTGGQGFSDFVRGTITIEADTIAPVVPQQCLDAGLHFDASSTVYLTGGDDTFDVGQQPEQGRGYLIFALGGDDVVTGSNQADCIVGGTGDDHLIGGNQGDVLLGSDGDDVLNGAGEAADDRSGGNGKDWLYGEAGDDELHGANGKDHLDGGDHVDGDLCVDEPNGNSSGSADDNPGGNGHDTFVGCEVGGPSDGPGNAPAVEAGPAQSQSSDSLDTGEQLDRQTDGGSDQQAGTAAQGTTAATQPSAAPTTQPSVAPTSDARSVDGQAPTSSPSTSPLSGPEPEVQTTTP